MRPLQSQYPLLLTCLLALALLAMIRPVSAKEHTNTRSLIEEVQLAMDVSADEDHCTETLEESNLGEDDQAALYDQCLDQEYSNEEI